MASQLAGRAVAAALTRRSGRLRLLTQVAGHRQQRTVRHQATYRPTAGSARTVASSATAPDTAAVRDARDHVVDVSANSSTDQIDLTWSTGEVTPFPYVWLKDNCPCPECRHPTSFARTAKMSTLDVNIKPASVQMDEGRDEMVVTWPDGHRSSYPFSWLANRTFDRATQKKQLQESSGPPAELWDKATIEPKLFRVDFEKMRDNMFSLKEMLENLIKYGLVVIQNCPPSFGIVEEISNTVGILRGTHYGKTFRVAAKVDSNNLAYTASALDPHLDMPYYQYVPGVQLLHCVSQHCGSGGDSVFVDAFHVANQLRHQRPEIFHILSTLPVDFDDYGVETESMENWHFHKIQQHKTIQLNDDGEVVRVCYNNPVRSYRLNVPLHQVKPLYTALKHFHQVCADPANQLVYKMEDGDTVVMNNLRVMHGRHGFTMNPSTVRQLEGSFVEWEEILCRYRAIRKLTSGGDPRKYD